MTSLMERLSTFIRFASTFRRHWPMFALAIFYFYLAYHALSGNQGLMRWVDYEASITRQSAELEAVKTRRAALEARAKRLSADYLDLDALDQQARRSLFVSHPNEYTIWLDQTP